MLPDHYVSLFVMMALSKKKNNSLLFQGKEFETRLKEKKPGDLSDELRVALGMPTGPVSASSCIALHNEAFPF